MRNISLNQALDILRRTQKVPLGNEIPITLINPMSAEIEAIQFNIENWSSMIEISGIDINTNLIVLMETLENLRKSDGVFNFISSFSEKLQSEIILNIFSFA